MSSYAEDNVGVLPDDMCNGFGHLHSLEKEERFYDFICTYVRRMVPDVKWRKKMKQHPEHPVFSFITPSDIAYVIALITNGRDVWDQAKRLMSNPDAAPEKKEKPLFSTGEGKKRESGKSVWNNEGLEFYYSVEKNGEQPTIPRRNLQQWLMGGRNGSQRTRARRIPSGLSGNMKKRRQTRMGRKRGNDGGKRKETGTIRIWIWG